MIIIITVIVRKYYLLDELQYECSCVHWLGVPGGGGRSTGKL